MAFTTFPLVGPYAPETLMGDLNANFAQALTPDASGNVGIGTSSPAAKLDLGSSVDAAKLLLYGLGNVKYGFGIQTDTLRYFVPNSGSAIHSFGAVSTADGTTYTERLRIDASGNLGLGVTPSAWGGTFKSVEVGGNASLFSGSSQTILANNAYNNGTNWIYRNTQAASLFYQATDRSFQWYQAPSGTAGGTVTFTQAMTLDANGNLGLGVTPSAWSGVRVYETNGAFYGANTGGTGLYWGHNSYYDGAVWRYKQTNSAAYQEVAGAVYRWYNAPSGTAGNPITFTQAMMLDASGNLLVGQTASEAVDIRRDSDVPRAEFTVDGVNSFYVGYRGASAPARQNIAEISVTASAPLAFRTADTERMRIDSAGNFITAGTHYIAQPAQTSKAAAATLTIAELLTGIVQYTGAAANLTLPTGTSIEGGVSSGLAVDRAFDFSVINTGSGTATVVTNTGLTTVGALTVAAGASGLFRVRKTATNTYTVYRIS